MPDKPMPRSTWRTAGRPSRRDRKRSVRPGSENRLRELRLMLCEESARAVAEEGIRDYHRAKQKACARLGVDPEIGLPSNSEIAQAVAARLRLFQGPALKIRYRRHLELALHSMDLLEAFSPRAVGTLLDGIVAERAPVQIHVFASTPEEVHDCLRGHGVPFDVHDKRYRFGRNQHRLVSGLRFIANDIAVEISVFLDKHGFEAPRCPIDGRAMRRASKPQIRSLLADVDPA